MESDRAGDQLTDPPRAEIGPRGPSCLVSLGAQP